MERKKRNPFNLDSRAFFIEHHRGYDIGTIEKKGTPGHDCTSSLSKVTAPEGHIILQSQLSLEILITILSLGLPTKGNLFLVSFNFAHIFVKSSFVKLSSITSFESIY